MVGVAAEDVAVGLAGEVLQADEVGEHRDVGERLAGVDEHELGALGADRDVQADGLAQLGGPGTGGENDLARTDGGAVAEGDAGDPGPVGLGFTGEAGDGGALADLGALLTGDDGEGHAEHRGVAASAEGLVGDLREVVDVQAGPEFAGLVAADELDVHAEALLHGDGGLEVADVLLTDGDHVAAVAEAAVVAEDLGGVVEELRALPAHLRHRGGAVVGADDAGGLAGHAAAELVAFDDEDALLAAGGQSPGDREAFEAAADDDVVVGVCAGGGASGAHVLLSCLWVGRMLDEDSCCESETTEMKHFSCFRNVTTGRTHAN